MSIYSAALFVHIVSAMVLAAAFRLEILTLIRLRKATSPAEAQFVMDRFVDHQNGEWYTALFHDGRIDSEKVGPWKAPYHVTRACLEVISRLGRTL